jgi:NAD kinase
MIDHQPLKFGIFVHPIRPKVAIGQIREKLRAAGAQYSSGSPDIGIVVGGDGTFGYYGRTLDLPLLFVGVKEPGMLGSRARLAEVTFDKLEDALQLIKAGKYSVAERRMLRVGLRGKYTDVLTDIYLERGSFSGCMRYIVSIYRGGSLRLKEYAIGNGVIISTAFGSGGYYSYPNRLGSVNWNYKEEFSEGMIGVCHIIPTYLVREREGIRRLRNKLSYTVPFHSLIRINLARDTDTRLYGTTDHSCGIRLRYEDTVTITGSDKKAKIIRFAKY